MIWFFIYPYGNTVNDLQLLVLDDPGEHSEFGDIADDIPGWFYNEEHIMYRHKWVNDENTNENIDFKYFLEDTAYLLDFASYGDLENVLYDKVYPWLFSYEGKSWIKDKLG